MTEKVTVEGLMGLAFRAESIGRALLKLAAQSDFADAEYMALLKEGSEAWQALESALTALIAERGVAVNTLTGCREELKRVQDDVLSLMGLRDTLRADNARLAAECGELREAVAAKWTLVDNLDGAGLRCLWCEGSLDYIKVPNGLLPPKESDFVHGANCIVRRCQ